MKKHLLLLVLTAACFNQLWAQSSVIITGMTSGGGVNGYGSTYSYNATTGNDSLLFSFGGNGNTIFLGSPHGNVIQAKNGKLYGMANVGGYYNFGGIFCYNPVTGHDSIVFSFNNYTDGDYPYGSLVQATNGLLYGMTHAGGYGAGTIFSYDPVTGKDSVLYIFGMSDEPYGSLIQATNGLLYGLSVTGGANSKGDLFSYDPISGKDSILVNFDTTTGYGPQGSLIQASNGLLYGLTSSGGTGKYGTMFSYNPATGKDSVLINFSTSTGYDPLGSLVQASNGLLYGMTAFGGTADGGIIFSYNTVTGKDSTLINFNGANGYNPYGSLMQASNGLLYGMTYGGGINYGLIFSYNIATGKDSALVNLTGLANGDSPYGDLFQASDGFLYGMTSGGGNIGAGVLFRLNTTTLDDTVLLNFGSTQYLTENSPIMASNGLMYGMTYSGGTNDYGVLFSYNPATGKDTTLIIFDYITGANPQGTLLQASNGLLYGMTSNANYYGNVFSYDPVTYKDSVLFHFHGKDGQQPTGTLIEASNGLLYGMTTFGGKYNYGEIFSYSPLTGKDSVLVSFNDTDGAQPTGSLIQASDGLLYGTTGGGGRYTIGVIFSYDVKSGKYDTLQSLDWANYDPSGNLIVDTTSHLIYGTCQTSLYSYNTNTHTLTTLFNFDSSYGINATGFLLWDTVANLIYGTTYAGGAYNYGVLYQYNISTGQDSILLNFHDSLAMSAHKPIHGAKSFKGALGTNPCGMLLTRKKGPPLAVNGPVAKKDVIIVYPNPFKDVATVLFGEDGKHYIEIDDMLGKKLRWLSTTSKQYTIERANMAAGMYMLKFYDANQHYVSSSKIMVQE
jgi:uncharacterized repeat protein (TIGR03803 family)